MQNLCYQLKVIPAFNSNIYRLLELDGSCTFAALSDLILDAFEFDHDHLYMFSLGRKPYDPNGIYSPGGRAEKRADRVRLQDVAPVKRNKYLYLYDFGDEWIFYITVMKIWEADQKISAKVVQSQGTLCQYPNCEDDWDEDGNVWDDEDDWDAKDNCNEYGCEFTDDLVITLVDEQDTVVKDKLIPLPAQLQNMWLRLVNKDVVAAGDREMELFNRLERAGLVEVDESETHLFLRVKHGKEHYKSYNIWDKLQERYDLEHILLSLAGIYGVVEQDILYELLCENVIYSVYSKELFEDTAEKLKSWEFWNCKKTADGTSYISFFCSEITEEILKMREKYPVKYYCPLSRESQDMLRAGGWHAACSVYGETFRYLLFERGWRPEAAEDFLEQLVKCVAMGYKEEEYFAWISEALAEHQLSLTKAMQKVFRKFRNELPSAALKGYTWGEYEKDRKDGYHQLSLFEEEQPFQ